MSTNVPIASVTLSAASPSVTFSGIPQTYTDLVMVVVSKWTGSGNSSYGMRFNSDSGSNYSRTYLLGDGGSASTSRASNQTNTFNGQVNSTEWSSSIFNIMNYSNSTIFKNVLSRTDQTGSYTTSMVALWRSTGAITSIDLGYFDASGSWASGSTFNLYGINAANSAQAKAAGGDSIYRDSSYWYHVFNKSGTFTPSQNLSNVDYLVVAGGGGGGSANTNAVSAGGGAGGLRCTVGATGGGSSLPSALSLTASANYTITIGAGGNGATISAPATNGSNSSISGTGISTVTSTGGGNGGTQPGFLSPDSLPSIGGSGGGAAWGWSIPSAGSTGAAGTDNEGYAGGSITTGGSANSSAGGGGAGAVGSNNGSSGNVGGNGGNGVTTTISGTSTTYAGGGGGAAYGSGSTAGTGGTGGGGNASNSEVTTAAGNGTANTGGGGGGASNRNAATGLSQKNGGAGGSGIIIVRYPV
jgi:hypothetical protein